MSIKIQCGIRPTERLLARLVLVEGDTGSPLADAVLMSLCPEVDEVDATVDALKIAFVSDVLNFLIDPQTADAIFGDLEPTVVQFDGWWYCDVYCHRLSMRAIVSELSATRKQPQVAAGIASLRGATP